MADGKTLLLEDNIVSLRTATVLDDGDLVYFTLLPYSFDTSIPGASNYLKRDSTWLYRHKRSVFEELRVRRDHLHIQQDIIPMLFKEPPEIKLVWTDSGESVALFLNGEPWAFIHEEKNHGYSKGILRPTIGNPWDQELFEKTFHIK